MRKLIYLMPVLSTIIFVGCTTVPQEMSFDQLQKDMKDRYAVEIQRGSRTLVYRLPDPVLEAVEDGLTVDDVVQIALINNPELQAIYEELDIAQADVINASLPPNPHAEVLWQHVRHNGAIWELTIVQPLLDTLLIPYRKTLSVREFKLTRDRVVARVLDVVYDAIRRYRTVQANKETLEVLKDSLEAARAARDMAQRLRKAGNIARLEVLVWQNQAQMMELALSNAKLQYRRSREDLNDVLGLWGLTDWAVAEPLPMPKKIKLDLNNLERVAIQNSLDLSIARRKLEVRAQELGITNVTSIFDEANLGVIGERESDHTWVVGPFLEFPLPLFDQGQGDRKKGRAILRRQWQMMIATAVRIRIRARQARQRFLIAREQLRFMKEKLMPTQKDITTATQEQYNAMQLGVFDLLLAKERELAQQRRYISTLKRYWMARYQLEMLVNGRISRNPVMGGGMSVNVSGGATEGGH